MAKNANHLVSQGIEELIERIKSEAVEAGKESAESIIKAAEKKAEDIIDKAKKDALKILKDAKDNAEKEKKATKEALELAGRDMILGFHDNMSKRFEEEISNLVSGHLQNKDFISQLLLIISGKSIEEISGLSSEDIEITIPKNVLNLGDIRKDPKLIKNDMLKKVTLSLAANMVKKGFYIYESDSDDKSIYIKKSAENISLSITKDTLTKALLKHLQPRFHALLEGLIK